MTKIGIITILKVNNYGAELQAYATQATLNKMGYDAEIIDYLFYKNPMAKHTRGSRTEFSHSVKKRFAEWLYPLIHKPSANKTRTIRFESFHKHNTRLSPTYRCAEELYDAKMPYDVYMVGSDQVWNPGSYTSLRPYFWILHLRASQKSHTPQVLGFRNSQWRPIISTRNTYIISRP